MGKVEKVIVLSVLFLIALILVVSLTMHAPLEKVGVPEVGARPKGPPSVATAPTQGTRPVDPGAVDPGKAPGMLNMGVQPNSIATPAAPPVAATPTGAIQVPAAPNPAPAEAKPVPGLPAGALLRTMDGLQDSYLPEMKLYTCVEKDTYRAIADRYYGDWKKFTVLRRSNEGRNELHEGDVIFVPVFDSEAPPTTVAAAPKTTPPPAGTPTAPSGKVHVVKEGESLWLIAKRELGNGGRWQEIADLNKDVLPNPKVLRAGLRLRMP